MNLDAVLGFVRREESLAVLEVFCAIGMFGGFGRAFGFDRPA